MIRNETSRMITDAKENYFSTLGRKLSDPTISLKTYWRTLNRIINKTETTNIPQLLENGIFVTNFQKKADIFNDFFVQQCSLNINNSVLPNPFPRCNNRLENINIDADNVLEIIRSLDCNKAHGWDNLAISMVKICDSGFVKPLCLIYEKSMMKRAFPDNWKKPTFFQYTKKRADKSRKTTGLYRCCLFVGKYLKS